jgi:hypothetical protein
MSVDAMTARWSARAMSDVDRPAVLEFFTEPDFHYRSPQPDLLSEAEIVRLLDEDTRVLLADGEPVGLYALEPMGSEHGCHYQLHLRLRASAPTVWWTAAYEEIVRAARWRSQLVRLTALVGEYDERGLGAADAIGLTREGTLAGVVVRGGRRYGYVYFSQIWTPQP